MQLKERKKKVQKHEIETDQKLRTIFEGDDIIETLRR